MKPSTRNVAVLCGCNGLLQINNSILMVVTALAGSSLAYDQALATLPLTMYFVGAAISTLPMSFYMMRAGRRRGFTLGALCGALSALACAAALYAKSFW